ncbi:MAG: TVP38/TMEM64 family protein [Clostridiaceae bacterium]|nr:TVP38/TMEM64 family protein [Clostridiaceae bacterium]
MKHKSLTIILTIVFIIIISSLIYINFNNIKNFYSIFTNVEKLNNFLNSFGYLSWFVYFLLQVSQVIIFVIPGELIQAAGGYVFGTYVGTLISFLGIGLGSSLLFMVCHKYGRHFVRKFVSKDFHTKFEKIINTKDKRIIIFILYLIPGIPKDSLVMLYALTDIDFKNFITFSMIGRLPALFLSTYFGANIANRQYVKVIILSIFFTIILFLTLIFKEKLLSSLSKNK